MPRTRWHRGMVVLTAAGLAMAACTSNDPQQPSLSPKPTSAKPSPTATSLSPDEQAIHDAVKAYYDGYYEAVRIERKGGRTTTTALMKATMAGDYLALKTASIQPIRYIRGVAKIEGYSVGATTPTKIPITGCENESKVRVYDSETHKDITAHDTSGLRVRQVVAVKGVDGRWRVDHIVKDTYVDEDDWATRDCMVTKEPPS